MANQQQTIVREATCVGVGLHSGEVAKLRLCPAPKDHGVVFARSGARGTALVPACPEAVVSTRNATCLARDGARVQTVEHLLAALLALGVDNVRIELEGSEVPAMDGSARPFADLLARSGTEEQCAPRRTLEVLRCVEVIRGERSIRVEPARAFAIDYTIDFDHAAIGRQQVVFDSLNAAVFLEELAPARTFGFFEQVQSLRNQGLARGSSLENTVVLGERGVLNPEGLRFADEFVRHKVVDLIGDVALQGGWLAGRITVERGGHALHHALWEALRDTPGSWQWSPDATAGGEAS